MYGTRYVSHNRIMTSISDTYMYGTGYDQTNHKLESTNAMNFAGIDWSSNYNKLNNNHYTCFNTSGECQEVSYIYYTDSTTVFYVIIPNGKTISGMLDEMFTNTTDSVIKETIDDWYASNMASYTSELEDTPYCNDRTIYELNGWSPTGSTRKYLLFDFGRRLSIEHSPSLICNNNDAFTVSVSNGNGKLIYPVGLLTGDEAVLAGGSTVSNATYYLYNNLSYFLNAPNYFGYGPTNNSYYFYIDKYGMIKVTTNNVTANYNIRPAVSLKAGTKYVYGGDGTPTNPYVVECDECLQPT